MAKLEGHQLIAAKNIKHGFNWIVGGYENSVTDGHIKELPPIKDIFDEIFAEVKLSHFDEGMAGPISNKLKMSMNMAGNKFIWEYLKKCFARDGYDIKDIGEYTQEKKEHKSGTKKPDPTSHTSRYKTKYGTMPTHDYRDEFGKFNKNHYAKWLREKVKEAEAAEDSKEA